MLFAQLLICPIRVVQSCEELTLEEWQAILELRHQVCLALKQSFDVDGFNFAWNMGEHAGQSVPHFHLHIVPRKKGDTGFCSMNQESFYIDLALGLYLLRKNSRKLHSS